MVWAALSASRYGPFWSATSRNGETRLAVQIENCSYLQTLQFTVESARLLLFLIVNPIGIASPQPGGRCCTDFGYFLSSFLSG